MDFRKAGATNRTLFGACAPLLRGTGKGVFMMAVSQALPIVVLRPVLVCSLVLLYLVQPTLGLMALSTVGGIVLGQWWNALSPRSRG